MGRGPTSIESDTSPPQNSWKPTQAPTSDVLSSLQFFILFYFYCLLLLCPTTALVLIRTTVTIVIFKSTWQQNLKWVETVLLKKLK
jgi:hypothetical protein